MELPLLVSDAFSAQLFYFKSKSQLATSCCGQELSFLHKEHVRISKFDSSSTLSESAHSEDSKEDEAALKSKTKHQQVVERRQNNFQVKKKTELCKTYQLGLACPYGSKCSFAHGKEELVNKKLVHKKFKTTKCKQFFENGCCSFGPRCQFLHKIPVYEPTRFILPNLSYSQTFESLLYSIERESTNDFRIEKVSNSLITSYQARFGHRRLDVFRYFNF